MMRKRIKILTSLLVVSLLLNVYGIYRLRSIEGYLINHISRSNNDIGRMLNSEFSGLHMRLNDTIKNNLWVQSWTFSPKREESTPNEIHLNFQWVFSEVEKGARVLLLYRDKSTSEGWTEEVANNVGVNSFSASLVLSPKKNYEYQIISEGNFIKTDEITEVPERYYKPMPLEFRGWGSSTSNGKLHSFQVTFGQGHGEDPLFEFYKVKSVIARIYLKDSHRVVPLEQRNTGISNEWDLDLQKNEVEEPIIEFILEIEYEDGTIEEKNYTTELLEKMQDARR